MDGNIQLLRVEMHSGDNLQFETSPSYEYLKNDFTIADGIVLPAGTDYQFTRFSLSANTANKRIVSFQPRLEWGTFYSGDRLEAGVGMGLRPRPGVTVNLSYEFNDVNLAEGSFTRSVTSATTPTLASSRPRLGSSRMRSSVPESTDRVTGMPGNTTVSSREINL